MAKLMEDETLTPEQYDIVSSIVKAGDLLMHVINDILGNVTIKLLLISKSVPENMDNMF